MALKATTGEPDHTSGDEAAGRDDDSAAKEYSPPVASLTKPAVQRAPHPGIDGDSGTHPRYEALSVDRTWSRLSWMAGKAALSAVYDRATNFDGAQRSGYTSEDARVRVSRMSTAPPGASSTGRLRSGVHGPEFFLEVTDFIAQSRRQFELQLAGRDEHLFVQVADEVRQFGARHAGLS